MHTESYCVNHHVTQVSGVFQTTWVSSEVSQSPEGRFGAGNGDTNRVFCCL